MTIGATVYNIIDYGIQIVVLSIQLVCDSSKVFWFHQLKLMTNRGNHAFVAFTRLLNKGTLSTPHLLFDYATPAQPVISKLAVPLIVVVGNFSRFQSLFRGLSLTPCFCSSKLVRFPLGVGCIPGIEEFASITSLWCFLTATPETFTGHHVLVFSFGLFLFGLQLLERFICRSN